MKKDIFENRFKRGNVFKIFFANIICFLLVSIVSIAFCYSYFSDNVDVSGDTSTALLSIDYRDSSNASISEVYAKLNNDTATTLTGISICPGDKITINGNAVNTSDVDIYVLGKLEVINKDESGNIIDTEVVWYNIANNTQLYTQRGIFQVGASVLAFGASQALSIPYTFEGARYNNDYATIEINFTLHSHQKDYLEFADDYDNYTAVGSYTQDSIYATHCMTGRMRDAWEDSDAEVTGLTLSSLETDSSGAYLINSCKDWMIVKSNATETNSYHEGLTFKLNSYLDFNNITTEKYIERLDADLDGQGYTICNWNDAQGVIGNMYGDIINIGVDGLTISANRTETETVVGGLVNYLYQATAENCFVIGASAYDTNIVYDINITLPSTSTNDCIGGLIGNLCGDGQSETITASVKNCYVVADISVTGGGTAIKVGGIVGYNYPQHTELNSCYYNGNINASTALYCGLLTGVQAGDLNNCFAITTSVTNTDTGYLTANPNDTIENCAYSIDNGVTIVKLGDNQTEINVDLDTFKSSGEMRDAFGWDTSVWASNIYNNTNTKFLVLRVFYNF